MVGGGLDTDFGICFGAVLVFINIGNIAVYSVFLQGAEIGVDLLGNLYPACGFYLNFALKLVNLPAGFLGVYRPA